MDIFNRDFSMRSLFMVRVKLISALLSILFAVNVMGAELGNWDFDNPTDLGADSSGNGLDGIVYGASAVVGRPLLGGGYSGAIELDGLDDYIHINGVPSLMGRDTITIAAWIKVPIGSESKNIFRARKPLALHSDRLQLHEVSTNWMTLKVNSPIQTDDWYHIAGVFDRGSTRIYINGHLANLDLPATDTFGSGVAFPDWSIGARLVGGMPDQFFSGAIDQVTIFDEALSAKQVLELAEDSGMNNPILVTTYTGQAIKEALDTASETGVEVHLVPGETYWLNETIKVPGHVVLRSSSTSQSVAKLMPNHDDVSPMLYLNNVEEVTLRDFDIDGAVSANQMSGHNGILISGSRVVHVDNVLIENLGGSGVASGSHLRIDAHELGLALNINGELRIDGVRSERNVIENNEYVDPNHHAFFGIRFWTEWQDLIPDEAYVGLISENLVQGNLLNGFSQGIEIAGPATQNNLIRENIATDARIVGVEADKGAKSNRFFDNQVMAVLPEIMDPQVRRIVSGMRDQGVQVAGHWAEGNVFKNNTISMVGDVATAKYAGAIYLNFARNGIFQNNTIDHIEAVNVNKQAVVLAKAAGTYVYSPNLILQPGLNFVVTIP